MMEFLQQPYYHVITPDDDRLLDASNRLDPHPNQNFNWGEDCIVDKKRYYDCEMTPSYIFWMRKFMCDRNISLDLRITDVWKCIYKKGSFQEPHDHPYCDIVSVIFLDDPSPKGGEFYFQNYNGQTPHVVQYKKGDMIVFSPKMIYGVTPLNLSFFDQIKKRRRRTVSINADIISWEPWEGSVNEHLYNEQLANRP